MNRLQKAFNWVYEKALGHPAWTAKLTDHSLAYLLSGGASTLSGVTVTPISVLNLAAAWSAISLRARMMGFFPIDVVKSDGSVSLPIRHQVADLLLNPNEYMDRMQFFEAMTVAFDMYGQAFAEIRYVGSKPAALWPLSPERMVAKYEGGDLRYEYTTEKGSTQPFEYNEILHIRNFSTDGVSPFSPVAHGKEVFGKALAASRYGAAFFKNSAKPSGAIQFEKGAGPTTDEGKARLKTALEQLYAGVDNAQKTLLIYDGGKWVNISVTPEEAQFIETCKMTATEIAVGMYGVPAILAGIPDKTPTYASAEQFNRFLVDYTLGPLAVRFELALTKALIKEKGVQVKFNLEALLRGDSQTQATVLALKVAAGLMTPNEARAFLNLPPMEGGDKLVIQSNMTLLEALKLITQNQQQNQLPAGDGGQQ